MHAGAHRGLGAGWNTVKDGRRQRAGGGDELGFAGRSAQRDSGVLGALDRLRGCLWWCTGGQNGQNATGGEGITMAEQLTGGSSLAKFRRCRSSGSIAGLGELPGAEANLLQGSAGSGVQRSDGSTAT
jgi:hypothetical protein